MVIHEIKAMRAGGKTLKQIANTLTERGIPTKTDRSDRWNTIREDATLPGR